MSRLIDADALIDDCKKYLNKLNPSSDGKECTRIHWLIGILSNAPTIEPERKTHWIPCSERLPKKHGESYLVTISDGAVYTTTLQWDANGKRWYLSFFNDGNILVDFIDDVIAWLPLPEPYQAERWE